ncbi:MAG TPA: hypothetical protein VFL80_12430 [Thermoanaerobaculia bacterium]|nr:hypothetical protein [Thermoanaerobaculia bacterium]
MKTAATVVLASLLLVPAALGTVAQTASFDEKVAKAERIFIGKCVDTRSQWDQSKRWIVTYSKFNVEESLKGPQTTDITLITPGGRVDGVHQDSIGVPSFEEGDEHVIFVKNTQVGPTVLYFDQGAYEVLRDERGERIVRPLTTEAVHVDTQRGIASASEETRTLAGFRTAVKESGRRAEIARMQMLERQRRHSASTAEILWRYRFLVAIALAGAALATWKIVRR